MRNHFLSITTFAMGFGWALSAHAVGAAESTAAAAPPDRNYGLTGSWGGFRDRLSDLGLEVGVVYKADLNRVLSGGLEQKTMVLHNLDLKLNVDAEKLLGLKGTSVFIYGIGNWGASSGNRPSLAVGDLQWTSNIETFTNAFKLYELWIQQKFADDKASLLFGVHDLNSEFYTSDSAAMFLHSSFGLGLDLSQSGVAGPSVFPYTTLALRFRADPTENAYLQSAIFGAGSGDPNDFTKTNYGIDPKDGFLIINEVGTTSSGAHAYKYGLGFWAYTRTFDRNGALPVGGISPQSPSSGIYLMGDQRFTSWFSIFARYGMATRETNLVRNNVVAGMLFTGLLPARSEDRIGIGFSSVASTADGLPVEWALEFSYRIEVGHGIAVQPDLQFVKNPGFAPNGASALDGAIRLEVSF